MDSCQHNPTPKTKPAEWLEENTEFLNSAMFAPEDRPRAMEMLQTFLINGGDPETTIDCCTHRWSLLTSCAVAAWPSAVQALLAAGADVHAHQDEALRWASEHGCLSTIECLLAAGADVHANFNEPLRQAARNDHMPVVERLLAAGADVHALREDALQWTVNRKNLAVAERLLAAGADVHVQAEWALRVALRRGDAAWTASLLRHGANAVHAIRALPDEQKHEAVHVLDAVAAAIPAEQRQELFDLDPHGFQALNALLAAARRRTAERRQGKTP